MCDYQGCSLGQKGLWPTYVQRPTLRWPGSEIGTGGEIAATKKENAEDAISRVDAKLAIEDPSGVGQEAVLKRSGYPRAEQPRPAFTGQALYLFWAVSDHL